jgi:outer membrane receptor for ferrienterochelin and colicin
MPYSRPLLCILLLLSIARPVRSASTETGMVPATESQATSVTNSALALAPVVVSAESNGQIQQIDPATGMRAYQLGPETIDDQGQGEDSGFNEILLHAPGISRESSGQFHLRAEDYGLQYRLNGILLPDGITSTLGQPFDSRMIERIRIISGALPAEYGLRNAGVINIETKTGTDLNGQEISMYGGSHATLHPSFSSGGAYGGTEYFMSGAYLQDDLGTDNVTKSSRTMHDQTKQFQGFALLSQEITSGQKLSFIFSGVDASFQIPNAPGLSPSFAYDGITTLDSSTLNRSQREQNFFGIISYQIDAPDFHLNLAEINSYSSTHYFPDYVGDLMFTGVASDAKRELFGTEFQFDVSYRVDESNTLKAGFTLTSQLERSRSTNAVFPTNPVTGTVSSDLPETLNDSEHERGYIYGGYLQDEWKPFQNLTINYGGRLDFSNAYLAEHQISPRISLVYRITPAFTVHAGYARIFSPPILEYIRPSVFAQFLNTTDAPTSLSDGPPQAERSHSFAAGATYQLAPGFSIGMEAYYKLVRNMQDETQLGESLIFTPFTYEHGRKMGIELSANYDLGGFLLYSNVAIARSEGRNINSAQGLFDQSEVDYISNHYIHTDYDQLWTISAGAAYRWKNLTWHTDLLAGSGMYGGFANSQKIQSHATLNLGAEYRFLLFDKTALSARFDVINVFDQSYLLHDAGIGATVNQYGERRGFFGGIRVDF